MILRVVSLCGGLAGAAAFSQYPAFSDAYLQRLAGQVDALTEVVQDFDASALAAGLGRETALQQMNGTAFLAARQTDMRATFARHTQLSANLAVLRTATPIERTLMPHRLNDRDTLAAAWSDFQPSLPLSTAGAASSGAGFVIGWAGLGGILALLRSPFRRPKRAPARPRTDPPVARPQPQLVTDHVQPRLGGVRR